MPAPKCEDCGKRTTPQDRTIRPAEVDGTGTPRPREVWHKTCLEDEADATSELMGEDEMTEEDALHADHVFRM
jgi:hypothetical protein